MKRSNFGVRIGHGITFLVLVFIVSFTPTVTHASTGFFTNLWCNVSELFGFPCAVPEVIVKTNNTVTDITPPPETLPTYPQPEPYAIANYTDETPVVNNTIVKEYYNTYITNPTTIVQEKVPENGNYFSDNQILVFFNKLLHNSSLFGKQVDKIYEKSNDGTDSVQENLDNVQTANAAAFSTDLLTVTGNTSIDGDTTVGGDATIDGNTIVGGDLNVIGTISAGVLNVAALSSGGALVAPYFTATSTTATSSFMGVVGIGTLTPSEKLTVVGNTYLNGNLTLAGIFKDSVDSAGSNGMILKTTGTSTQWVATSSLNIAISDTSGTLSATRGGTGLSLITQNQLLIGGPGNTWTQIATSSLGFSSGSTFLGLTDTPSSFTANRLMFTNSGATALTDSANLVFDGTNFGIGSTTPSAKLTVAGSVDITNTATSSPAITLRDTIGGIALELRAGTSTLLNTFIGVDAGKTNTTGSQNSAYGYKALFSNTTGSDNSVNGYRALYNNTTGSSNIAIGSSAGRYLANGSSGNNTPNNSVYLGSDTKASASNGANEIVIGYSAIGAGSNTVTLGSTTITTTVLQGNVGIGTTTPLAKLDITGSNSTAVLGSELISATADRDFSSNTGKWTGTNWSIGSGVITHTAGANNLVLDNTALSSSVATGTIYQVTFTTNTTVAGTLRPYIGGSAGVAVGQSTGSNTQTQVITADTSEALTFNLDGDWTGTIDNVSVKIITPSSATQIVRNSDGSVGVELRSGGIGLNNTFLGLKAGRVNATGSQNTANGASALYSNTTGINNTANGYVALYSNTTGSNNTANGMYSLYDNTTGSRNTANGFLALEFNTTGSNNTANGYVALDSNTTGSNNTANGALTLYSNTTGSNNVANGYLALYNNITGSNNVAEGYNAGRYLANGSSDNASTSKSVFLGYDTRASIDGGINEIVIGSEAIGAGSNTVTLGSTTITKTILQGNVGIGTTTPNDKLTIIGNTYLNGDLTLTGALKDSTTATGTLGMIMQTTGTSTQWVATSTLGLGNGTFLGLTDTPSSFTANRLIFTNSGATALTDSADLTFDGTNFGVGAQNGIAFGGTRYLYASSTNDSLAFGEFAGATFNSGTIYNTAIGFEAGRYASSSASDYNNFIGHQAGYNNDGERNNIIGITSGLNNTGSQNNLLGTAAGYNNTGSYNNIIGYWSGLNSAGSYNNLIGYQTSYKNVGNYNEIMGYQAGYNLHSTSSVIFGTEAYRGGAGVLAFQAVNNVALGYQAGYSARTGADNNILIGYKAADNLVSGSGNIVIGYDVDVASTTRSNQLNIGNLIFGTGIDGTGTTLSSGNIGIGTTTPNNLLQVYDLINFDNTASSTQLGYQAGKNLVTGATHNTFIGYQAGYSSSTGSTNAANGNTVLGYQSLYSNTSGTHNTANGKESLYSNTSGSFNIANGTFTLYTNTTGNSNTANGYASLYSNTTGSNNTAIGYNSLTNNTTGSNNTAIGYYAARLNTTGTYNTANGYQSLYANLTGSQNIALGYNSGRYLTNGSSANASTSKSIFLGYDTRASINGGINEIVIGAQAIGAGSNTVTLGSTTITTTILQGNVGIGSTTPSSKLTVTQSTDTFTGGFLLSTADNTDFRSQFMATSGVLSFYGGDTGGTLNTATLNAAGEWTNASDVSYKDNIDKLSYGLDTVMLLQPRSYNIKNTNNHRIGFIAQEVEEVIPEVVSGEDGSKGISYGNLVAVAISAIQELAEKVSGFANLFKSERIETNTLCVGNVCVTEAELKELLQDKLEQPSSVNNNSELNIDNDASNNNESPAEVESVVTDTDNPSVEPISENLPVADLEVETVESEIVVEEVTDVVEDELNTEVQ